MTKSIYITILSLFIWATALAQPVRQSSPEDILSFGKEKLEEKDYINAVDFLEQSYEITEDLQTAYDIAGAYESYRDYRRAEIWYKRVFRKDKEKNFPDAQYKYARMLKAAAKYEEAQQELYAVLTTSQDESLKARVRNEILGIELALTGEEPLDINITQAGDEINSEFSEYSPSVDPDGNLYFGGYARKDAIVVDGSEEDYHAKIYMVKPKKQEETQEEEKPKRRRSRSSRSSSQKDKEGGAKALSRLINREGYHTSNVSISPDGERMYFTRAILAANNVKESIIYMSKRLDGEWAGPDPVENINGDYLATHPIEGELFGNRVLYFAADMEGGEGGFDIYYSTIGDDGSYKLPVNLGEVINTPGDEITPYYQKGILYFSSDHHAGLGGMDVFSSQWNGTNWSLPNNLGKGYNSSMDDTYFRIDDTGYEGFIVSNRPGTKAVSGKKTCCDDIYMLSKKQIIIDLMAGTVDQDNKALQGATVKLVDVTNGEGETRVQYQERDYLFSFPLEADRKYKAVASKAGFETDSVFFDTDGIVATETIQKKLTLKKEPPKKPDVDVITINETIRLRNIYYDFDDDKILPDAEKDLRVLLGLLNDYPTMVIELSSHTDAQGNDDYNQALSQRRAVSARQWLLDKGVNPERVVPKGYGEEFILNQCTEGVECTDDEHRYNRRTEFKIIAGPTEIEIKRPTNGGGGGVPASRPSDMGQVVPGGAGELPVSGPTMSFETMKVDLGTIKFGEKKTHSFSFVNTGDADLVIEHASACTCTEVDWPALAVKPGDGGKIDIVYDSTKKDEGEDPYGEQEVYVEMITNTKDRFVDLVFTITVEK